MATTLHGGPVTVSLSRDEAGHRTYKVQHLVRGTPGADGPLTALLTAGLPAPGQAWQFGGVGDEADAWAWCRPEADVKAHQEVPGEAPEYWLVEQTFSTRPPGFNPSQAVGDPLAEPPKVTINFVKTTEEATRDRFGRPLTNSAWEQLRGKQVEFDGGMVAVQIVQNVAVFDLAAHALAYQAVNSVPMWGMPRRTVKLSSISRSEPKYYGAGLSYLERTLGFEANYAGWDRDILDEGTKVLRGHWQPAGGTGSAGSGSAGPGAWEWVLLPDAAGNMPNPYNPRDFIRFTDPFGNVTKGILNGRGEPAGAVAAVAGKFIAVAFSGNTGQKLSDSTYWIPVQEPVVVATWNDTANYPRGGLVSSDGTNYVALKASKNAIPALDAAAWRPLPAGQPTDHGFYNAAAAYALGDVVQDSVQESAGVIHVEQAREVDFVVGLGVPSVI